MYVVTKIIEQPPYSPVRYVFKKLKCVRYTMQDIENLTFLHHSDSAAKVGVYSVSWATKKESGLEGNDWRRPFLKIEVKKSEKDESKLNVRYKKPLLRFPYQESSMAIEWAVAKELRDVML